MKKLIFIFALLCGSAFATTRYVAQSAGTFSGGTACNGQTAITPATWNALDSSLAAGDLTWICGTLTGSSSTLLTFPNAGTSGNITTLKFDTGATITYPAIPVAGAIVDNQNYTLIDGNSLAGMVTSTTNGDCSGCSTTTQSNGILMSCTNCEVKNLNIGPIFQRSTSDSSSNGNATQGIAFAAGSDVIKVDGCHISNARALIFTAYSTVTSAQFYNNTLDYSSWMIVMGDDNSSDSATGVLVYGNTLGPHFNIWQDTAQTMHADGIYMFAANASSSITATVYHNTITSDMCTNAAFNCTGLIYLQGNSGTYAFNNLLVVESGAATEGDIVIRGNSPGPAPTNVRILNNTIVDNSTPDILIKNGGSSSGEQGTGLTWENNIFQGNKYDFVYGPSGTPSWTSNYNDFYGFTYIAATNGDAGPPTNYSTLTAWQALGFDANSSNGNPLLTSYIPQSGSAAIGLGTNLTSTCSGQPTPGLGALCSDANGNARPSSGAWTAGAYNAASGGPPLPPTGLTATVSP